jgi:hypothetical protein
MEPSAASHLLFRVLLGRVRVTFGSGRTRPQVLDVGQDDIFVVLPFNHYGLHNASGTAEALLFCVHSWHGGKGAVAAGAAGAGEVVAAEEGAGGDEDAGNEAAGRVAATEADSNGTPAKRRKCHH